MKIVLIIWGILVGLFGFMEFTTAGTVMQQIAAGNLLVAATVAFGAFGTINAIEARKVVKVNDPEVVPEAAPEAEVVPIKPG